MNKKTVSGILLILLLMSMLSLAFSIQPVEAEPEMWTVDDDGPADFSTIQGAIDSELVMSGDTIYVHNGTYNEVSVDKGVALIAESKNAIILGQIPVEANGVTICGFTVNGLIRLGNLWTPVHNTTVEKNALVNGAIAIEALPVPGFAPFGNNTIIENSITNSPLGIHIFGSRGNKIIGNILRDNEVGILLEGSNTTVLDNIVENCGVGMHITALNNTLSRNTMADNICNFGFGRSGAHPNYIDTSNTINDRPIYFIVNQNGILVEPTSYPNTGFLAVIGCENVTVRDFILSGNGQGILLQGGGGNTLLNNTVVDNVVGVQVVSSDRNELTDNTISDNGLGMWLIQSSSNTIANNELRNNTRGILGNLPRNAWIVYGSLSHSFGWSSGALNLKWGSSNTIVGNTMSDSDFGVFLTGSSHNTFRNNRMARNIFSFSIDARRFSEFVQDIDDSNTVNGKPMIYWTNAHERQVPENAGYVAIINSTDIAIRNLDITNNLHGILVVSSNNTVISGNNIANCSSGISIMQSYEQLPTEFFPSLNITVHSNLVVRSGVGVLLYSGEQHTVSSNDFWGNMAGIHVRGAERNAISGNTVTNSTYSSLDWRVRLDPHRASTLDAWWWYSPVLHLPAFPGISVETANNTIVENTIGYNEIGLVVGEMSQRGNNTIYHNSFINNTHHQALIASENIWDDGYSSGGNYWSDYAGVDEYGGQYQDETGSDGIGDTPYKIYATDKDRFPLMGPLSSFSAGTWNETTYQVKTISNSTISDFQFSESEKLISFNVTGPDDAAGFCRVTIPNALLGGPYVVLVNDFPPLAIDEQANGTHTFLYFTYIHSTKTVEITGTTVVPEFSSWISMLLLFIAFAVTIATSKRRLFRTPTH